MLVTASIKPLHDWTSAYLVKPAYSSSWLHPFPPTSAIVVHFILPLFHCFVVHRSQQSDLRTDHLVYIAKRDLSLIMVNNIRLKLRAPNRYFLLPT